MHLLVNIWEIFLNTADPLLFFPSDNSAKRKQVQGFFGNKEVYATFNKKTKMQLNGSLTPQTRICAELGGELLRECPEKTKIVRRGNKTPAILL